MIIDPGVDHSGQHSTQVDPGSTQVDPGSMLAIKVDPRAYDHTLYDHIMFSSVAIWLKQFVPLRVR